MAGRLEDRLREETVKWLERLVKETKEITKTGKIEDSLVDNSIENIFAYIKDCRHFLEKNDYINAFEAIVYAWGIYETCLRLGVISGKEKK